MTASRTPKRLQSIGGVAVALSVVIGCTASPPAQSGQPSSAPVPSSTTTATATPIPTASAPTPSTPTPSGPPVVGAAPAGPWTQVTWVAAGAAVPLGPSNVGVVGWSGGFVAFDVSGGDDGTGNTTPVVVRSSASADGLRWSEPTILDGANLGNGVELAGMVEGPAGLLMIGNELGDTCGGPPGAKALWTSPDGRAWHRVPFPKVFAGNRIVTIDAGSSGYLATGIRKDGSYRGIWTSQDAVTWRTLAPPTASNGTVVVNDGTSFSGGFVLAGAILGPDGCGGPSSLHPSVWWSANGQAWTRETTSGASTADDARMAIERISDQLVLAIETTSRNPSLIEWVSSDGRAWSRVASPSILEYPPVRSDGRRAVIVVDPESGSGPPKVDAVDESAAVTELAQHGAGPVATEDSLGWTSAFGPTGIVVVRYDGSDVWLGVPS